MLVVALFLLFSLRTAPLEAAAFPGGLLVILMALSVPLAVLKAGSTCSFRNVRDVAAGAALLIAYVIALPRVGFIVSTVTLLFVSIILAGYRASKIKVALISAAVTVAIYWPFVHVFGVPLP